MQEFNRLVTEIDNVYHQAAKKLGITDSERDILYILTQGEFGQSDICHILGVSKQTVNSAVQKMVKQGILETPTGQRREKLKLTTAGELFVEEKIAPLIHAENRVFEAWTEEERTTFLELNRKYLAMFQKEVERL